MTWQIDIPDEYRINKESLKDQNFQGPAQSMTTITFSENNEQLTISAVIVFPQMYIPLSLYKELINFMDQNLKIVKQDIILSKP